jgi:hypothetical protein
MAGNHTIDVCKYCGDPVIQWNNTGAYEHLNSARLDQAESRAYHSGAQSINLANATLCNSPRLAVEKSSTSGKTDANSRTATKKS